MANAGTIAPSDRRAAASTSQSSANVPGARDTTYSGSVQRQLPKRRPRKGLSWPRLSWWFELATVAVAYLIYEATRALVKSKEGPAISHGKDILHVERWAHLDPEVGLNHFLNLSKFLSDGAAFYYSALHFLITPLVLIYLWRRHPEIYPRFRSALLAATAVALVVFVAWPVAPPRLTTRLTDTLLQSHLLGLSNPHGVTSLINQYAAMPSLHVGWAVWCAAAIATASHSRWRYLAWAYPAATTFVVLATANHYLLDAVAGATLMMAAIAFTPKAFQVPALVNDENPK